MDDAQETVMGRVAPLSDSQNCSLSVAWLGHLITAVDGEGGYDPCKERQLLSRLVDGKRACDPACKTPLQYSSHQRSLLRCSSPSYWISVCHIGLFLFSSFSELVLVTRARTPFV